MNPVEALLEYAKNNVPFHRRRAPKEHLVLANWPLMSKEDLSAHPLGDDCELLSELRQPGGYIVASGGTTTKPKFIYYSHEEVTALCKNVGDCMMVNGMEPGDGVVNYLTSGDMWSSFIMIDRALSGLPVTVYPLGYTPRMESSAEVFERFKPNVVIGIPSMILNFARYTAVHFPKIKVQKVFYGGEAMPPASMDVLSTAWNCEIIRSVGYSSTDIGSIGWQCPHCEPGEHYAFEDTVIEIVDDEIVVTPMFRRAMPIIRYRTGDKGRWVTSACGCSQGSPRFQLLGRLDNVLLLWGCRILFDRIVEVFENLMIGYTAIQALIESREDGRQVLLVSFEAGVKLDASMVGQLRQGFYESCEDIQGIVPRESLDKDLFFAVVPAGTLERNSRTGKVIPVIDSRA